MGVSKWNGSTAAFTLERDRRTGSPSRSAKQAEGGREGGEREASKWPLSGVEMPFPQSVSVAGAAGFQFKYPCGRGKTYLFDCRSCAALFGV